METKINIMGLDIDIIDIDTLISKTQEYLNNDCLNVILMANTTLLEESGKDEELKQLVMGADLIVPGDETLLSMHHVETLKIASIVVNYSCFKEIFSQIKNEERNLYIVARNEKETLQFEEFFTQYYPNIKVEGAYYDDLVRGEELVLNKINSIAPDIVLLIGDSPLQESWIMTNKTKLNSKLCIAIGEVSDKIVTEQKAVPVWISRIKMDKLYLWSKQNKGVKRIRDIRIFKKKMEHYKNKKGGSKNGDSE